MKFIAKCCYCRSKKIINEETIIVATREKIDTFLCLECYSVILKEELVLEQISS